MKKILKVLGFSVLIILGAVNILDGLASISSKERAPISLIPGIIFLAFGIIGVARVFKKKRT
jgi:hypothetical protein